MTLSSDSSDVQSSPSSVNAALPPHAHLHTSYPHVRPFCIFSFRPLTTVPCLWLSFYVSCLLSAPDSLSGFSNGILEVFEPEALNYFTFFRRILLILSVSRNPFLTHLPFYGSLDSLVCVLIAPTPGLAFSLLMPSTLATVSSFKSVRAYLSVNFLHPLFLRSIPTLII